MFISTRSDGDVIAALVATRHRDELLLKRCLPSILAQTRPPNLLVIVVDEGEASLEALRAQIEPVIPQSIRLVLLRNYRTRNRAAATWNTGIDWLLRPQNAVDDPASVFVAIIDDDDAWEPAHLELCIDAAAKCGAHMAAAGLIRHETAGDEGRPQSIPRTLDARANFIRNQHIQGSNLFVRLDVLAAAGMFDERLSSCTDRDLCIRLAELPGVRFVPVDAHTVHHYADPRQDRLSTPGAEAKCLGLDAFFSKYKLRFDLTAVQEALTFAKKRFGWSPTPPVTTAPSQPLMPSQAPGRPWHIVAGFTTDASWPVHAQNLMRDLLRLATSEGVCGLDVVIVENGPMPRNGDRPLHDAAKRWRSKGLSVFVVRIEDQNSELLRGIVAAGPPPGTARLPIPVTRTILSAYVRQVCRRRPGAAAWLLDDDKRLNYLIESPDGARSDRPSPDLAAWEILKSNGVHVLLGPDTDSAPLPVTSTIQTQLIDMWAHLAAISTLGPDQPWPDHSIETARVLGAMRDNYHDHARTTEHLETPVLVSPHGALTAADVLHWLGSRGPRMRAGELVFRPLALRASDLAAEVLQGWGQRGGSAVFIDPEKSLGVPQSFARLGDRFTRRSDSMHTTILRDRLDQSIVRHPAAAVQHDRSTLEAKPLEPPVLVDDVLGYAVSRAFEEACGDRARFLVLARKYADERMAAVSNSLRRSCALARQCLKRLEAMVGRPEWSPHQQPIQELIGFLRVLAAELDAIGLDGVTQEVARSMTESNLTNLHVSATNAPDDPRMEVPSGAAQRWFDANRTSSALARVAALVGSEKGLRVLGCGSEGTCITNGNRCFKVIDAIKPRHHEGWGFLRSLIGRTPPHRCLPDLLAIHQVTGEAPSGANIILECSYTHSEPYAGGMGPAWVRLLQALKSLGVACRNIKPDNVRILGDCLQIIDVGADLVPWTSEEHRRMAKRAFLTWRWWKHADLQELLRQSLRDEAMPHLDGFSRFWAALNDEQPSPSKVAAAIVDPLVIDSGATTVLDYGCGKSATSAINLAKAGLRVVGYDPGDAMPSRWRSIGQLPPGLRLTSDRTQALVNAPFDAVVCSLVLCELEYGPEYERVIADLRASVRDSGTLIITVCNPSATFGGPTPIHTRRDLPTGVEPDDSFWFTENACPPLRPDGRREFHRPIRRLERDLLRHGIAVTRRIESSTVDLERFVEASDFLVLVCRPVQAPRPDRDVSLVIKACAMEAATIERQVEHLVRQLEGPRVFCERVLALDSRQHGFLRQYADADRNALRAAASRLVRRGYIDRVIEGPEPGHESNRINREWFGLDCDATHSLQGGPLATPLSAFEQCRGEYILQVDSDLLVFRPDHQHDNLGELIGAMEASNTAFTTSLNIARRDTLAFSAIDDHGVPWRVESRGCLLHRSRLIAGRPYPNTIENGKPKLHLQRSLDQAVRAGVHESLRGGTPSAYFVHPPNSLKQSIKDWMLLLDGAEKSRMPAHQFGQVDFVGEPEDWVPACRSEPFVFVITGRNVPIGRAMRCIHSVLAQRRTDWGAVVIDDASEPCLREHLARSLAPWADRFTLIQPRERRGQLANTITAIRKVCADPDSVILTLDLDDALLGPGVLDRIAAAYKHGADMTTGSMLRTDKHADYPVRFDDPRTHRGGNVWQHLRTFRKGLFDAIPDEDLRVGSGYAEIAVDWAFMIPITEMAQHPVWIREPLYLYEPSGLGKGTQRDAREREIAQIMARPRLNRSALIHAERMSTP